MAKKNKTANASPRKGGRTHQIQMGVGLFVPIMLVLGIIPLIVQMRLGMLPEAVNAYWPTDYVADFFSYYKSKALLLVAIAMLCVFGYYKAQGLKDTVIRDKSLYVYFGAMAVFAVLTLLSTLLSAYKDIALWGGPERCEGMVMLLIYFVLALYALWAYLHKPEFRYILLPLGFLTLITGFLGVFQFWGHDLFTTDFGKSLIISSEYRSQGELKLLFDKGKIYGTMYHYNYMGSFGAMMVPMFLVLALFLKERKHQIFCAAMTAIALFVLLGSTSRAGIIGLALAVLCFLLFFCKKLVQHYKITLGCVAALVVLVLAVNVVTGGLALARIPSLLNDVKALVSSSNVDFHDEIPVRQIDLQSDQATFTFQDGTLTIQKNANNQPVFIAGDGQTITAPGENCSLTAGNYKMELQYAPINNVNTPFLGIYAGDRIQFILGLYDEGFSFVDSRMNKIDYVEAPAIGFQGKEKLGSSRGYIWSRSIPMLLDNVFIGDGPDTFFANFPQGDMLGKLYAYDSTQEIVDKPHNLYLQIGIGEGMIALLAFLVLMIAYVVDSFRLYALRKEYTVQQTIGAALALAVIGYLGAGFFNDSIVSVAPIFWVLFGTGVAVNLQNHKQSISAESVNH